MEGKESIEKGCDAAKSMKAEKAIDMIWKS